MERFWRSGKAEWETAGSSPALVPDALYFPDIAKPMQSGHRRQRNNRNWGSGGFCHCCRSAIVQFVGGRLRPFLIRYHADICFGEVVYQIPALDVREPLWVSIG
jgi:hypothetical protein